MLSCIQHVKLVREQASWFGSRDEIQYRCHHASASTKGLKTEIKQSSASLIVVYRSALASFAPIQRHC